MTAVAPESRGPRWGVRSSLVAAAYVLLGLAAALAAAAIVAWRIVGEPTRARVLSLAGLGLVLATIGWLAEGAPRAAEVIVFTSEPGRGWIDALTRASLGLLLASFVADDTAPAHATPAHAPVGPAGPRLAEVDRLRAAGIVSVVLIHALPFQPPITYVLDYWLADALRFAVPTLVFISGWLLPADPTGRTWLRHRLRRVVPPYLVATGVMMALARLTPAIDARPVWESVLLGRATGPYYYVFVLVVLTLATPLIARLGSRGRWALLAAALPTSLVLELADLPLVWHNHLPLTWLPWYLAGWQLRHHRPTLLRIASRWDTSSAAVATVALLSLMALPIESPGRRFMTWVAIATTTGALLLLSLATERQPAALTRALSERSYLVYLYHPPIVAGVAGVLGASVLTGLPLWSTVTALATCLLASQLARLAWPGLARRWLGA